MYLEAFQVDRKCGEYTITAEIIIDIEQIEAVIDNTGGEYRSYIFTKGGQEFHVHSSMAKVRSLMEEAYRVRHSPR